MWHLVRASKLYVRRIMSAVAGQNVISEPTLSYSSERPIEDLDLIYKKEVLDLMPETPYALDLKALITISGLTVIDWEDDDRTDINGDVVEGVIWADYFGDYPNVSCYIPDGNGNHILATLVVTKLQNGNLQIDATGLTDVIVIIS